MRTPTDVIPIPAIDPGAASPPQPGVAAEPLAEITTVPKGEARRVLSPANLRIATALTLLPIPVGLLGGIGLIATGIAYANANQAITAVCVVAGVLDGVLSVVCLLHFQKLAAGRYLKKVAERAFAQRTDPLVRCDDPQALFLEIIPRHVWQTFSLEPQSDIGYWKIDPSRREFLFEGDVKRYRIPFDSVTRCEVEEIRLPSDQWGTDLHFAVVLDVETSEGSRELPLFTRHLELASRRMLQRNRQADLLCAQLREALGE
jgi:hypothetical protein